MSDDHPSETQNPVSGDAVPEHTALTTEAEAPGIPADDEERMWAMFCHLSSFAEFIFPFGHILGPLVVYLLKKDEYASVADQGKESLNFQISCSIYLAVLGMPVCILWFLFPLLFLIPVLQIVFVVLASLAANKGELYRYPLTIRFLK